MALILTRQDPSDFNTLGDPSFQGTSTWPQDIHRSRTEIDLGVIPRAAPSGVLTSEWHTVLLPRLRVEGQLPVPLSSLVTLMNARVLQQDNFHPACRANPFPTGRSHQADSQPRLSADPQWPSGTDGQYKSEFDCSSFI